ncbi:alpha-hydroxy acid oxidase [Zestomonas carbonaria]|uniref:4-hydroxymandelate oxidase n=1 Tax=Zestomonas carbonaria TaxID=2762745 RepID=A0A7U7EMX5_9GAMM|nr:alpha-hydroxy acid oxidase [Pseudomonas carbonaria]CAD5107969.1 4-hydroxymandelate oxidase [Pseudomonas carbonaria]
MHQPLPKLQQIPPSIAAVADYEPFARERMSEQAWAYIAGGSADELTLRDNCAAFQRLRLRSRVLRDLRGGHTRVRLLGQEFEHPILLAPVAYQKLAHPEGELASALGASALGAGMVVSTQASVDLEEIARQVQAPLWFQLYIQPDREFTASLVRRVEAAGYRALVLTVDAAVSGIRNREQRAGFALPEGVEAVNLRGMRQLAGQADGRILLGTPLLETAPTWEDLQWLRSLTRLPVLVKGVMCAEDARRAVAEGVDGIIVSNHGGRTLDGQPATIEVLAEIAEAVEGRVPLLMDGGIRRGGDILKALALGASAVLVGRPYVFGLAAAGAVGVAHVLQILRAELEVAMALTGCRTLADIEASLIYRGIAP